MRFSIIVPVYKVEKYLNQCIDSIVEQKFMDFELILVDDGSPDESPAICDFYEKKDTRVKVVHKSNGGLSSARNAGLNVARGEYIIFVDSDDWIEPNCLAQFDKILREHCVDVLMTVKTSVYEDKKFLEVRNFDDYLNGGFGKTRALEWILYHSGAVGAPNKIIRRDLIEKCSMRFFEGILHEDYDWTFKICLNAESYYGCSFPWYNYRMIRDDSITNTVSVKNITSVILTAKIYFDLYKKTPDRLHEEIYHRAMDATYISINKVKNLNDFEVEEVISFVSDNKAIFKYARKINQKLFLAYFKLFGAKRAINFLRKF